MPLPRHPAPRMPLPAPRAVNFGIAPMHGKHTQIRCAHAPDAEALVLLLREPWVAMSGRIAADAHDEDAMLHDLHRADTDTLVADGREGMQGFLQLRWGGRTPSADWMRGSVELRRLYVRVRHRGAGVAAGLLEHACGIARERAATCMWLRVGKQAEEAINFYRTHGFRIAGAALSMEDGRQYEHWVMHKTLAPRR
ncbi:GNAT family N-acetyltransferase [Thermomonas sp.]|uniref:GNAT family N-acetyltransferase n=1 Tax=Thermomonas sp. TaxID=1971895 RepID=UPI0039E24E46